MNTSFTPFDRTHIITLGVVVACCGASCLLTAMSVAMAAGLIYGALATFVTALSMRERAPGQLLRRSPLGVVLPLAVLGLVALNAAFDMRAVYGGLLGAAFYNAYVLTLHGRSRRV